MALKWKFNDGGPIATPLGISVALGGLAVQCQWSLGYVGWSNRDGSVGEGFRTTRCSTGTIFLCSVMLGGCEYCCRLAVACSSCDGLVATVQVVEDLEIRVMVAEKICDGDGGFGYRDVCDDDRFRWNCG